MRLNHKGYKECTKCAKFCVLRDGLVYLVVKLLVLKTKIAITALASISPLGKNPEEIWRNYLSNKTLISTQEFNGKTQFIATIPAEIRKEIEDLRKSEIKYKALDETVLLSILVSRQAIKNAGW